MRPFLLTLAALIIAPGASPAVADNARLDVAKALTNATEAYRDGDCLKASSLMSPVIDAPASASGQQISLAYDVVIDCAWQAKDLAILYLTNPSPN